MPEGDSYVTEGALLRCDKGVVPTPLTIVGPRASRVNGRLQATMVDCVPLVNVLPFGVCALTHGPCLPPALVWTQAHPGGRLVGGALPLLESSVCQCGLGGRISISVLPVPGMPPVGSGGAGLEALGEQERIQREAREQAEDDRAHEASGFLKKASGALALFGLACVVVGFVFPPAAVVGAVALELSEVTLVAAVVVDVAVAINHPTQDNWVEVGVDVVAVGVGYAVGKVIIGPALGAIARALKPAVEEEIAAESAALSTEAAPAAEEVVAEEMSVASSSQLATEDEANEIRILKEKLLAESPNLRESANVATAKGTIDGKPVDLAANSSKVAGEGTVPHKPLSSKQLKTQPTESDIAKGRTHEALRAYDSEVKILENVLDNTTPESTGEITITSLNDFCNSCENAIDVQMKNLRPGIKINKVYTQPYKNK